MMQTAEPGRANNLSMRGGPHLSGPRDRGVFGQMVVGPFIVVVDYILANQSAQVLFVYTESQKFVAIGANRQTLGRIADARETLRISGSHYKTIT